MGASAPAEGQPPPLTCQVGRAPGGPDRETPPWLSAGPAVYWGRHMVGAPQFSPRATSDALGTVGPGEAERSLTELQPALSASILTRYCGDGLHTRNPCQGGSTEAGQHAPTQHPLCRHVGAPTSAPDPTPRSALSRGQTAWGPKVPQLRESRSSATGQPRKGSNRQDLWLPGELTPYPVLV